MELKIPELNKRLIAEIVGGLLIILALCSMAWNWYRPKVQSVPFDRYVEVPVEKKVETIKRVTVPGPERIVTIEKQVIVEKLKLPTAVADNPNVVVTGNADIPASDGGMSVVSTLDTTTGETTIIAKEKPVPLFGFPNDREVMLRYGFAAKEGMAGNLAARYQFLRVGNFFIGAYGEIDTRADGKAMLEAAYRF